MRPSPLLFQRHGRRVGDEGLGIHLSGEAKPRIQVRLVKPDRTFANATSQVERKAKRNYGNPTTQEPPQEGSSQAHHLAHPVLAWLQALPGGGGLHGGVWYLPRYQGARALRRGEVAVARDGLQPSTGALPQPASLPDPDAARAQHAELQAGAPAPHPGRVCGQRQSHRAGAPSVRVP